MTQRWTTTLIGALALFVASAAAAAVGSPPVAKVIAYEGAVEYRRNDGVWRPVVRPNKYLLPGYEVRTGKRGSAEIEIQSSGKRLSLDADSLARATDDGVASVRGKLSEPREADGSFLQAIFNKFVISQRWTTVRRGLHGDPTRFKTAYRVTLSNAYPEFAWQNVGPAYSYRVEVDGQSWDVPIASTAEMIRLHVPHLAPGEHALRVSVLKGGKVVHTATRTRVTWMGDADERTYLAEEARFRGPDADPLVLATFQSERGFKVAAMDTLRAFFARYPDEHEVRPMLAESYGALKIVDLQSAEAQTLQVLDSATFAAD